MTWRCTPEGIWERRSHNGWLLEVYADGPGFRGLLTDPDENSEICPATDATVAEAIARVTALYAEALAKWHAAQPKPDPKWTAQASGWVRRWGTWSAIIEPAPGGAYRGMLRGPGQEQVLDPVPRRFIAALRAKLWRLMLTKHTGDPGPPKPLDLSSVSFNKHQDCDCMSCRPFTY